MKKIDELIDLQLASEITKIHYLTLLAMAEKFENMPKVWISWRGDIPKIAFPASDLLSWFEINEKVLQGFILDGKETSGIFRYETKEVNGAFRLLMKESGLRKLKKNTR